MVKSEVALMLKGYGLTTAEMIYRMPDHRNVLNSFVWQDYDLAPITRDYSTSSPIGMTRSRGRCIRFALCIAS